MDAFDCLHPALQHHLVNSLGWRELRPLQEEAIPVLVTGEHGILLAPTAGGKTEAAVFPVLTQMLNQSWDGLSVLYVCPIKALLNNLYPRLEKLLGLLGRRSGLWHGDVGQAERQRMRRNPPDLLLTTPESLEVLLVSRATDKERFFSAVRVVIVDEIHAFAGDDRGWHLLSVLSRIARLGKHRIQRIGLSATVGNPEELLTWLTGESGTEGRVLQPAPTTSDPPVLEIDFVGNLENAALVISRLHRGEKRLVFADSRERVESLAVLLRMMRVTTHVSHSSLSADERHRAEQAFAEGADCVIVATSTLELGIDVGDLDRVIQIDAPKSVSSVLQRMGRTGRRKGTHRNCLFLCTNETDLLCAAAEARLIQTGWCEDTCPPAKPYAILAQQIMALALQQGGIGRRTWWEWLKPMPAFREMPDDVRQNVLHHMLQQDLLFEDSGVLCFGVEGEQRYGFRHFMALFSVFTSPPMFKVFQGRKEIGEVHEFSFSHQTRNPPVITLAGQCWELQHIDWERREAFVAPSAEIGRSRWLGAGPRIGYELAQTVANVLCGAEIPARLSTRASETLSQARDAFAFLESGSSILAVAGDGFTWWTFGGDLLNAALAHRFKSAGLNCQADSFGIHFPKTRLSDTEVEIEGLLRDQDTLRLPNVARPGVDVKFAECVPEPLLDAMFHARHNPNPWWQLLRERPIKRVEMSQ